MFCMKICFIHLLKKTTGDMNMKCAVVVGASSGIGREVSRLLAQSGWRVGLAARRESALEETKADFSGRMEVAALDINDERSPQILMQLVERLGGMDLYFHASGIGKQNLPLDEHIEMNTVETNAKGFARMVGTAYRYMEEHGGGHIAVVSSIAGTKGLGAAPSYSATKAFQSTYIEALEQQAGMRKLNIRFTDIRPGFVDTPLLGGSSRYPMLMSADNVARDIVRAINKKRRVHVIDWRYRAVVFFWQLIPRCIWRKMRVR